MQVKVSGKQIDIGAALSNHVEAELGAIMEKYAGRPTDAATVFSKDGHEFVCEATVHLSTGMTASATGRGNEIYASFDAMAEKMDKQLRRYKRRLKDHHRDRPVESGPAAAYVLASSVGEGDGEGEPDSLQPMIIAEMETNVPALTVGEAVMQMELAGAPVLVFRNELRNSNVNVVYRREDGNIGWIDPS